MKGLSGQRQLLRVSRIARFANDITDRNRPRRVRATAVTMRLARRRFDVHQHLRRVHTTRHTYIAFAPTIALVIHQSSMAKRLVQGAVEHSTPFTAAPMRSAQAALPTPFTRSSGAVAGQAQYTFARISHGYMALAAAERLAERVGATGVRNEASREHAPSVVRTVLARRAPAGPPVSRRPHDRDTNTERGRASESFHTDRDTLATHQSIASRDAGPPGARAGVVGAEVLSAPMVARLTSEVIRAIDHRIIAQRERMGGALVRR